MPSTGSNVLTAKIKLDASQAVQSVSKLRSQILRLNQTLRNTVALSNSIKLPSFAINSSFSLNGVQNQVKRSIATPNIKTNTWNADRASSQGFSGTALRDLENLKAKITEVITSIKRIQQTPINLQTDSANKQLETMRKSLNKALQQQDKMKNAVLTGNITAANSAYLQVSKSVSDIQKNIREWRTEQEKVNSSLKTTNSSLKTASTHADSLLKAVRNIALSWASLASAEKIFSITDTITGVENQLNAIISQSLSSELAYTEKGYSDMVKSASEEMERKIFSAANTARSDYQQMMSNVGKTMFLAPDAFGESTDAAIRFQEIMAEAYQLSGSTQQEMEASMYQMTQALGAGILAGDELRSVREGATMVYKEIEKFAQSLYDTDTSLKDLASQGKITSNIVVAAVLSAGDEIDAMFARNQKTVGNYTTLIRNQLISALGGAQDAISDFLNSDIAGEMFESLSRVVVALGETISKVAETAINAGTWIYQHWNALKVPLEIVGGTFLLVGGYATLCGVKATIASSQFAKGFTAAIVKLKETISTLMGVKAATDMVGDSAVVASGKMAGMNVSGGTGIFGKLGSSGSGIFGKLGTTFGKLGNTVTSKFGGSLTNITTKVLPKLTSRAALTFGGIAAGVVVAGVAVGKACGTAIDEIATESDLAAEDTATTMLNLSENGITASDVVKRAFVDAAEKVGTAWHNVCSKIGEWLNNLRVGAINLVQKLNGSALAYFGSKSTNTLLKSALDNEDIDPAARQALETLVENGGIDQRDIIGEDPQLKQLLDDLNGLDDIDIEDELPDLGDVSGYDYSDLINELTNISANTGSTADSAAAIADSMEITSDDLKYLRDLAEKEWKKEFTTANIFLDMENYNNVNTEQDLDGLMGVLADKLEEELTIVANGTYL